MQGKPIYDMDQFSEREKEVTNLLLQGKSNKQIAMALGISANTVEYHLKNIYRKLKVSSRTEAVLRLVKSVGSDKSSKLGKSVVEINEEAAENDGKSISTRRFPMRKLIYIIGGCLIAIVLGVAIILVNRTARNPTIAPVAEVSPISTAIPIVTQNGSSILTPATTDASLLLFEYSVVSGDTCESIAATFDVSVESILGTNHLSSSCPLADGQILLILGHNAQSVDEVSASIPAGFYGEWKHTKTNPNISRVLILAHAGATYVNMFGVCQPVDCDWLGFSPPPTINHNYDSVTGILNVQWTFDFQQVTQKLTLTNHGQLEVMTQGHYLDNSGRTDYDTIEYFIKQ